MGSVLSWRCSGHQGRQPLARTATQHRVRKGVRRQGIDTRRHSGRHKRGTRDNIGRHIICRKDTDSVKNRQQDSTVKGCGISGKDSAGKDVRCQGINGKDIRDKDGRSQDSGGKPAGEFSDKRHVTDTIRQRQKDRIRDSLIFFRSHSKLPQAFIADNAGKRTHLLVRQVKLRQQPVIRLQQRKPAVKLQQ